MTYSEMQDSTGQLWRMFNARLVPTDDDDVTVYDFTLLTSSMPLKAAREHNLHAGRYIVGKKQSRVLCLTCRTMTLAVDAA